MMNNMKKLLILAAATTLALVSCSRKAQTSVNPAEYKSANPEGMKTVQDFLKATHTYFLATVDGDQPQVRPFGTAEIIEGKLDKNESLRSMYNENDDNTAIFFMTEAKATINSFTEPVVEIDF